MKLIYRIIIRIALMLTVVLGAWAVFFYIAVIDEVNDEVDDSLEDYSETIIIRALAGEELPSKNNGSNNQYYLRKVSKEYADEREDICYKDSMVYIVEKEETEPARVLRTIFADKDDNYFLLEVSTPSFEKEDLREAVANWILFLYIVLLVTLLTVCIWVFYRSLRPLYALLNWLDSYLPGKQHGPVLNDTRIPEFRRLNEAAAQAVERSEQLFKQQKQFIGNASHELQTPLAVCNNRIEWLLDNTELTEEQMEELFKTKHTLNYIVRLNKSLLFLSRIDNGQFTDSRPVEINSIVKRLLDDYKEIFSHYKAQISLEEQGLLKITMNETLAESLISNLLKNAFIHNKEKGHVRVTIQADSLTIANTGQTVPLDSEHIFERFYQGSKKKESTGLGLAIAEAICRQYGLHISYRYQGEEHIFLLQFYLDKS